MMSDEESSDDYCLRDTIVLCCENPEAISHDVWTDLVEMEECNDLKKIVTTSYATRLSLERKPRVRSMCVMEWEHMQWYGLYGCSICRWNITYPDQVCDCDTSITYDVYLQGVDIFASAIRYADEERVFSTIIVFHSEEWLNNNLENIERSINPRVYHYRAANDIVRRPDLEPELQVNR